MSRLAHRKLIRGSMGPSFIIAAVALFLPAIPAAGKPSQVQPVAVQELSQSNLDLVVDLPKGAAVTEAEVTNPANVSQLGYDDRELRDLLSEYYGPELLGDFWITPGLDETDRVIVQSTGSDSQIARLQAAAERYMKGRIWIVPGKYSLSSLQSIVESGFDVLDRSDVPGSVGISNRNNQRSHDSQPSVRVTLARDEANDELFSQLRDAIPEDLIEVELTDGPPPETQLLVDRDTGPPFRAGQRVYNVPPPYTGARCTSGYVHVNGYGYFGTNAGHCAYHGRETDDIKINGTTIDNVRVNLFEQGTSGETYADVETYSFSVGSHSFGRAVLIDNNTLRGVVSRYNDNRTNGSAYCAVGDGVNTGGLPETDQGCGVVDEHDKNVNNATTSSNVTDLKDIDCGTSDAFGGWSGGPVYLTLASGSVKAAGSITTGGLGKTCWTIIPYAVFLLNAEIAFA